MEALAGVLVTIVMEALTALLVQELRDKATQVEEGLLEAMEAVVVVVPVLLLELTAMEVMGFNLQLPELQRIMEAEAGAITPKMLQLKTREVSEAEEMEQGPWQQLLEPMVSVVAVAVAVVVAAACSPVELEMAVLVL